MPFRRCSKIRTTSGANMIPRIRSGSDTLRLREAGMIKSSPQKILAENTDWRFFNELKRELKS